MNKVEDAMSQLPLFKEGRLAVGADVNHEFLKNLRLRESSKAVPVVVEGGRALVMSGEKFALISFKNGLVEESTYLNRDEWWLDDFSNVKKTVRLKDKVIVSGNPGYKNYYHWVYQIWMGMVYARAERPDLSDVCVLGPKLNGWRRQFVRLAGLENYIEAEPDCAYLIDQAIYTNVSWGGFSYSPSSEVLASVDGLIKDFSLMDGMERIFISRKDTPKRGVENEDALMERLQGLGFKSVLLSDYSVEDQVRIFRSANFIVAPHGAGLTNLVFSGSSVRLVELIPDDYVNSCFYAICAAKGIDYRAVVCRSINAGGGYHHSKLLVDLDVVASFVKEVLCS